jgi:hypothetical protein
MTEQLQWRSQSCPAYSCEKFKSGEKLVEGGGGGEGGGVGGGGGGGGVMMLRSEAFKGEAS